MSVLSSEKLIDVFIMEWRMWRLDGSSRETNITYLVTN